MRRENKFCRLAPTGRRFAYARVLGETPHRGRPTDVIVARLAEFVEAFGHPESCIVNGSRIFFWNFVHELGGDKYFTCQCRVPVAMRPSGKLTVEVQITRRGSGRFFSWFVDRHLAVSNTYEPPMFSIGNGPIFTMDRLAV